MFDYFDTVDDSASEQQQTPEVEVTRWLLDTRTLWVGDKIQDTDAQPLLGFITASEREAILRKYHISDAKMSLASALLKRAYIAKCTGLHWSRIEFFKKGDPKHGKPAWKAPLGKSWPKLDFNVSHQAGLVILVGACRPANASPPSSIASFLTMDHSPEVLVGCDIVHPHERNDIEMVRDADLDSHVSIFDNIFSDEEIYDITYTLPSHALTLPSGHTVSSDQLGRRDRTISCDEDLTVQREDGLLESFSSEMVVDAKLRRFYAFFALKEAYIKLVGEGLLAPWIRNAEFRNVKAPVEGQPMRCSANSAWGGRIMGGGSFPSPSMRSQSYAEPRPHREAAKYPRSFSYGDALGNSSFGLGLGITSEQTVQSPEPMSESTDVLFEMTKQFSNSSLSPSYASLADSTAPSSRSLSLSSTVASTPYFGLSANSSSTSLATMGSPNMYEPYIDPFDPCPSNTEYGSPTFTAFDNFSSHGKRGPPAPLSKFSFAPSEMQTPAIFEEIVEDQVDVEDELELHLHDKVVKDVRMEVQSFEENFMFATMVQPATVLDASKGDFPAWERLDLLRDVVFWATAKNASSESSWKAII